MTRKTINVKALKTPTMDHTRNEEEEEEDNDFFYYIDMTLAWW
jgi:hypothetical protein